MSRISRRLPAPLKRLAPVVRERDALRARIRDLEAQLESERDIRAASPAGVHGTYVGNGRVLIKPVWGGRILAPADDLSLMPELVTQGLYDQPFTAFLQRHIKPGDTVFDIGANIGVFTLLAAYQVWEFGRVVAYEASPHLVELLRDNVAMNWLNDRVEIIPKAAAAANDVLPFFASRRFATGSVRPVEHLLASEERIETVERIQVEAEPLDVHLGRFERIDLVKIDVEGGEEQVFAGMTGLLEGGVIRRVSFEVARDFLGDDWEPFTRRLRALEAEGWRFATIATSGDPELVALDTVFERGLVSQVLMTREDGA